MHAPLLGSNDPIQTYLARMALKTSQTDPSIFHFLQVLEFVMLIQFNMCYRSIQNSTNKLKIE